MEQNGAPGVELLTYRQGTDEGVVTQDRESGGSLLCMRSNTECGTLTGVGLCRGQTKEAGGYLDGQRILCGGSEIFGGRVAERGHTEEAGNIVK